MPYYRRRRFPVRRAVRRVVRRTVRRPARPVRRVVRRTRSVPRPLGVLGFPRQLFTKLRYCSVDEPITFTGSATPQSIVWRANGAYDPQYAVGGGQPRFYDTLLGADSGTAPYQYYNVIGCKIQVTIQTENGIPAHLILGFRPYETSAPTTLKQAMETNGYKVMNISNDSGAPACKTITMYRSIAGIAGKSKRAVMDDDEYSADYNTTPAAEILADVIIAPVAATSSVYYVTTKVTYYLKCYGLNNVDDS